MAQKPTAAAALVLLGSLGAVAAQPQPPSPDPAARQVPPQVLLGTRVEALRRKLPVIPTVVVVPDDHSYVEAIARWTPEARYPVLIDDGSWAARENIARFVRGFRPTRVVRWSAPAPAGNTDTKSRVETAVARAWGATPANAAATPTQTDALAKWKQRGLTPPGVIIADPAEDPWIAALALAAGRAQPIIWARNPINSPGHIMPRVNAEGIEKALRQGLNDLGLAWAATGDDIDAATLCLNCPNKIGADYSVTVATTDFIGRTNPDDPRAPRWAWCGQIFGDKQTSAYRAMGALFLQPRRAWIFDGYPPNQPWSFYDGTAAGEALKQAGIESEVIDTPNNGERGWRLRCALPVDAGLILVNTKGERGFFDLEPGRCLSGDVPILEAPPIVHVVHSWSMLGATDRETVGGRWLERGAYAYFGSVQEPTLNAFVPTPKLAERIAAGSALGAAVRLEGTPVWRVALMGDPLITLGPPAPRTAQDLPLEGAADLEEHMKASLKGKDFAAALLDLLLLGRDGDVARLAIGLLNSEPKSFTHDCAAASILALFRAGRAEDLPLAFSALSLELAADGARRDALWLAAYPLLPSTRDEKLIGLLRQCMRPDSLARDAMELARPVGRLYGRDAAAALLASARDTVKDQGQKAKLQEALQALGGR